MTTDVTINPVKALEAALRELPEQVDIDSLTSHHFCDGLYARELLIPAGVAMVGKTHATRNFFVLVKGTLLLATPDGPVRISAPYMTVTEPGTKRAVFAETDCVCMNFHANPGDERDMDKLEARYITPEALPAPDKELLE
jgi:hypothetical protein